MKMVIVGILATILVVKLTHAVTHGSLLEVFINGTAVCAFGVILKVLS